MVKNTIKCSRQPFWYILLENASCRNSEINLHQFMFFTFFRSACTTQNFRTKMVAALEIKWKKTSEKRWQSLALHMTSEPKRSKENKVVRMDHSPGWGSICWL